MAQKKDPRGFAKVRIPVYVQRAMELAYLLSPVQRRRANAWRHPGHRSGLLTPMPGPLAYEINYRPPMTETSPLWVSPEPRIVAYVHVHTPEDTPCLMLEKTGTGRVPLDWKLLGLGDSSGKYDGRPLFDHVMREDPPLAIEEFSVELVKAEPEKPEEVLAALAATGQIAAFPPARRTLHYRFPNGTTLNVAELYTRCRKVERHGDELQEWVVPAQLILFPAEFTMNQARGCDLRRINLDQKGWHELGGPRYARYRRFLRQVTQDEADAYRSEVTF